MSEKKDAQLYSNETRQSFIAFDVQDGGFSTFEDFKRACNSFSPKLSEKIIVEAFRGNLKEVREEIQVQEEKNEETQEKQKNGNAKNVTNRFTGS
ncbi:EF-hand calcium-binding domain-containing protein 11 [Falco biarmicus]|nr:EF-hand calcium-binding domain-containing protein 11 [Falco biarmicus]